MIGMSADEIGRRAGALVTAVRGSGWRASVIDGMSTIGGGSAPTSALPTRLVALERDGLGADALDAQLRAADPPVIGRIVDDEFVLDLRTVLTDQDEMVIEILLDT
jgi:L-seryl-tRNA(Ser) seleniumtransferase